MVGLQDEEHAKVQRVENVEHLFPSRYFQIEPLGHGEHRKHRQRPQLWLTSSSMALSSSAEGRRLRSPGAATRRRRAAGFIASPPWPLNHDDGMSLASTGARLAPTRSEAMPHRAPSKQHMSAQQESVLRRYVCAKSAQQGVLLGPPSHPEAAEQEHRHHGQVRDGRDEAAPPDERARDAAFGWRNVYSMVAGMAPTEERRRFTIERFARGRRRCRRSPPCHRQRS